MQKYFFTFLFLIQFNAFGKITLLTSLDFSKSANPQRFSRYESDLENIFKSELRFSNEELQIKHKATAYDLWLMRQDPTVTAFFWLSEDFYAAKNHPNNGIYTAEGFEVSELFRSLPIHIEYRAIIGCYSSKIIKEKNIFLGNENQIQLFDTIIEAKKSLRLAIQNYLEYKSSQQDIKNQTAKKSADTNQIKITIKRTNVYNDKTIPELLVSIDNELLTVLKPLTSNESQSIDLYLNKSQTLKKIIIKSVKNLYFTPEHNIGSISIESPTPYSWSSFSNPITGEIYGINSRTFIPKIVNSMHHAN